MFKARLLALIILLLLTTSCVSPAAAPVTKSLTTPSMPSTPAPIPPPTTMLTPSPTPTPKPSVALAPARFVLGDLTITPTAVMVGEQVTYSIQVSNIGGTEGSYTVVFKYKSSGGAIGSDNVVVTLEPGQTRTATFTTTKNESGTYFVNVNDKFSQYAVTPVPTPIYSVPATSACAITSPPPSMVGINTHTEVYGTAPNPDMITLGPKTSIPPPEKAAYATHHGMVFELKRGAPVLAPIDMVLVGFSDTTAEYRIQDGQKQTPYYDLELIFESASPDWPGMIIKAYHLYSSPLLIGHNQNPDGSEVEEWGSVGQAKGHLFGPFEDSVNPPKGTPGACEALIGYTVKRGELIGFVGGVGTHTFVDFCFKVSDTSENPTVKTGNRYLHWVQPGLFFYWKSYSPDAVFPSGVLAYPFECDGYQLPAEQHDVNFKYTARK
ncbi:MAG: CARDB domain-containing protein [Dehalococcoidia bacterium]|nr:CARDB domain-containing protein [Dehalococcoidia bacterium]